MLFEALRARLKTIEEEILRLTKLASQSSDRIEQDSLWRLAQDLQLQARELRLEMKKLSEADTAEHPVADPPKARYAQ